MRRLRHPRFTGQGLETKRHAVVSPELRACGPSDSQAGVLHPESPRQGFPEGSALRLPEGTGSAAQRPRVTEGGAECLAFGFTLNV